MAHILIVADEPQVLTLAESYLQQQGHRTISASSKEQALAALDAAHGVDLLFTDVGLKDDPQSGLELARAVSERKSDIKVLYATGQVITDGMKAMMIDGSATLEKPYTVDQLQAALIVYFGFNNSSPQSKSPTPSA
jgi:DNA-binding NtrC family response regulator